MFPVLVVYSLEIRGRQVIKVAVWKGWDLASLLLDSKSIIDVMRLKGEM